MKLFRVALGLMLAFALSFGARADIPLNHGGGELQAGAFSSVATTNPNTGDTQAGVFSSIPTTTPVGTLVVTNQAVDCGVPAGSKGTVWGTSSSYPDWVFILWDAGTTNTIASTCSPTLAGATLTAEQKTRASWVHWNQVDVRTTTTTTTHGIATTTPVGTRLVTNQAVDCGIPAGATGTLWGTSSSYPDWVFILWDAGYTISTSCSPVLAGATLTSAQIARASWVHWNQVDLCSGSSCTATAAATLSSLSVSCPTTLTAGGYGSCTATAYYSDGSSKSVSPTWTSSNSSVLYISYGSLYAYTVTADTTVTVTGSYTDSSGATKSASSTVTVKAAQAALSSLTISGDLTVKSGSSITLTAKALMSDGSSQTVYPSSWTVNDTSAARIDSYGVLTALSVTSDRTVMVTASYTSGSVTKTATWTVTVKASTAALSGLSISGNNAIKAGDTAAYTASAAYGDGSSKTVSNVQWSVSGVGATIDSTGTLTASSTLTADATVMLTAIYTEGSVTKTATLSVTISKAVAAPTAACTGTGSNLSEISVVGSASKQLGQSLEVDYCLKNFNQATRFDIYVAVVLPDGTFLFMQSAGFFGLPSFTPYDGRTPPKPYLANTLIPDRSGPVLQISTLPMEMPTGTYTFHAIPVFAGKDVFNGFNWVGNLASKQVNMFR